MKILASKQYAALVSFIDTVRGISFSPYDYVNGEDTVLTIQQFISLSGPQQHKKILWGYEDASGDSIYISLLEYFRRYVYDVPFVKPAAFQVLRVTEQDTIRNLVERYGDCIYTRSYFPGFDKKYNGMDWRALRLFFYQRNGRWYLTGIMHEEWRI